MEAARVRFLIADIVHPRPQQVLRELFEKKILSAVTDDADRYVLPPELLQKKTVSGEVVAVTDDGENPKSLLVVKLPGMAEPVIVPTSACLPEAQVLSLLFDLDEFKASEIADTIALISDLYKDLGGDGLVIDGTTLLDAAALPEPLGV